MVNKDENSLFAATTFFAKSHPSEVCGTNGLPLTPNSIAILGRAQKLKRVRHDNLCQYLDVIRSKHERIIVVSEYRGCALSEQPPEALDEALALLVFRQLSCALTELARQDLVAHNLEPKHVLLLPSATGLSVKLFNYGLYEMTNAGRYVPFPIGNIKYLPPERLLGLSGSIKSDVWSLGMIVAELLLHCSFWSQLRLSHISRKLLSLCKGGNVFERLAREHHRLEVYESLGAEVRSTVERCLSVRAAERPLPQDILALPLFQHVQETEALPLTAKARLLLLRMPLEQIYHWWQLAGGDVQAELKREGLIRSEAPILAIPQVVCLNGCILGPKRSQSHLMDDRVVPLRLQNLFERLKHLPALAYFPLIHSPKFTYRFGEAMEQLPLVIRERNTEYQFYRIRLFSRLLQGYPFTADLIRKEAAIDIPPLLRGPIWSCLLEVIPNGSYGKIDKYTATSTDRQIEVDIPRCHQYDELLSSPEGHGKLKRLLKAWVTAHPQYVYWQGLDSLTAPFLYLNFNDEELAFLSLYQFIPKYLQYFFLKDNSAIIKEYLSKFSQLTAFYEPLLARHLVSINFIPELFAIPWFLTMFSHVFPLHKILHLWDKLMLGDDSYPLYIGIAILKQLKSTLLSSGFNECILLFSDLPDIVMENCVLESQQMYEATPKSVSHRFHVVRQAKPGPFDITADLTLAELQKEISPRISAHDLTLLLRNSPEKLRVLDIRPVADYNRVRLPHSVNLPFASLQLAEQQSLDQLTLEPAMRKALLEGSQINVCVSNQHEDAVAFSRFLVECGVARVCILHQGFNILHPIEPNILISN